MRCAAPPAVGPAPKAWMTNHWPAWPGAQHADLSRLRRHGDSNSSRLPRVSSAADDGPVSLPPAGQAGDEARPHRVDRVDDDYGIARALPRAARTTALTATISATCRSCSSGACRARAAFRQCESRRAGCGPRPNRVAQGTPQFIAERLAAFGSQPADASEPGARLREGARRGEQAQWQPTGGRGA